MYLVLCSAMDIPAQWAYQGLVASGLDARLVTAEMLESATQWEHLLDSSTASISFVLADGQGISGREVQGVLNRLMAPSQNLMRRAVPADRDYALHETTAFYLSWLNSLTCPMLNQPTPQGLAGRWLHLSELTLFADQAGLATVPYRQSGSDAPEAGYQPSPSVSKTQVVLLDGEVFGAPVPSTVGDGCRNLARLLQTRLLGVEFHSTAHDPWTFAFANPVPDLQIGGPRLVECLARTLQNGGRQ